MFVRRLIDLSAIPKELHFHVRLNTEARSDIWWWVRLIERCNGQGLLTAVGRLLPSVTVQFDESRGWGCGAVWGKLWLHVQWPSSWTNVSIAPKELAPIVFAALVFGRDLQNHHVLFQLDNSTVVAALHRGTCRDPRVMQLLCMLHFVAAHYGVTFTSAHLPGRCNTLADAISRNQATLSALISSQLLRFPIPSHQPSSTWCAIWRWTGHRTIETVGCALACLQQG